MRQMQERMSLVIFPNEIRTQMEQDAFDRACMLQIAHEREQGTQEVPALPQGVKSFQIGHFQMSFGDHGYTGGDALPMHLCSAAYSVLLRAGLLYRGVERVYGAD